MFSIIIAIWITAWAILLKLGGFWVHYLIWPYVIFEIPKMFLTAYAIAYLFFHILITQFGFSELFRRIEINVQPLHHDGAGGLASIGKLIGSYFYWLIAASFFVINAGITTTSQQSDFPVYVILQFAILPIFTCLAFFGPSLSTHTAMQRSIERQLKGINEKYEILLRSVTGKKSVSSANELKNLNEFINTSIRIREISPTWPFNSQTYYRFLASLGTSLIPLMLTLVENYLFDFLPKIKP